MVIYDYNRWDTCFYKTQQQHNAGNHIALTNTSHHTHVHRHHCNCQPDVSPHTKMTRPPGRGHSSPIIALSNRSTAVVVVSSFAVSVVGQFGEASKNNTSSNKGVPQVAKRTRKGEVVGYIACPSQVNMKTTSIWSSDPSFFCRMLSKAKLLINQSSQKEEEKGKDRQKDDSKSILWRRCRETGTEKT